LNDQIPVDDQIAVMKGSINCRYYGQQRVVINEQLLSSLAAMVFQAEIVLTEGQGTLVKSKAL
jgi:hypothetical protein